MDLDGRAPPVRFLIHDRDSKFSGPFEEVFGSEGTEVILTPIRAPNANAFAERWVRTVRAECLDWMLVQGRRHLDRVLRNYVEHYNRHRPHRSLALAAPVPATHDAIPVPPDEVRRRDVLGGLIHEYYGWRRDESGFWTPTASRNGGGTAGQAANQGFGPLRLFPGSRPRVQSTQECPPA